MNFDLRKHTILLTVAGSRAYGTHTQAADLDVKGVAIPPRAHFLGYLQHFEQADKPSHMETFTNTLSPDLRAVVAKTKLEGSVYNLVKFCKLAADANPNILDVLFCRDAEVLLENHLGRTLREARDMFISAKAKHTFSGYSASQLRRIRGHRKWLLDPPTHKPTREEFGLPEFTLIPKDHLAAISAAVSKQIDRWEIDFGSMADSEKVHIQGHIADFLALFTASLEDTPPVEDAKWLAAARVVGVDDNLIHVLQREREYGAACQRWKQYAKWKKSRNPTRAALEEKHGFDAKHGMHLVRLLRMGREIMETGEVHVWRGAGGPNDSEELLAIRNGAWEYDKLVEWAETEDKALQILYKQRQYAVRGQPDRKAIDNLVVRLVEQALDIGQP